MLRPRHSLVLLVAGISSLSAGCASVGIKNGIPYFAKHEQWEPETEEEDKWASVGKIGRGNRPLEDERDPVKGMIMSKQAQDIERNLGYK
ncbi:MULTISPECIES: hypothetical protein [unclassified Schlesneria]|uniref:hypothetical protein n=1 Tax=Schlesneria TaxID=656899 RepID=UPI002EDFB9CD